MYNIGIKTTDKHYCRSEKTEEQKAVFWEAEEQKRARKSGGTEYGYATGDSDRADATETAVPPTPIFTHG